MASIFPSSEAEHLFATDEEKTNKFLIHTVIEYESTNTGNGTVTLIKTLDLTIIKLQ